MRSRRSTDWSTRFGVLLGLAGIVALARHLERQQPSSGSGALGLPEKRASDEPVAVHLARATEAGRGRDAASPAQIPWPGWKDIAWRVYQSFQTDRVLAVAGSVVFYALLAIVPAITAFVSIYGLFADPKTVSDHLFVLESVVPGSMMDILRDQIGRISANSDRRLTIAFAVGLAIALWSANAAMKAIFDGLNIVYDEQEKRSFIRLNVVSLTFTLAGIVFLLLAVAAVVVLPVFLAAFGLGTTKETVLAFMRWPALFVMMMLALAVVYRFGPSRREPKWRWVSVGSLVGTVAWIAGSVAFSWYLSRFANYNVTYGSLGAVIGMMMWLWVSAIAVLLGAEVNAEIEHQTARDSTNGPEKPIGARGAVMADTVGQAAE